MIYLDLPTDEDDDSITIESIEGRPYLGVITMTDSADDNLLNSRCLFRKDLISIRDAIDKLLIENPFGD
jgi:hypothetical protein